MRQFLEREYTIRDSRYGDILTDDPFIRAISVDEARSKAKSMFPSIPDEFLEVRDAFLDAW